MPRHEPRPFYGIDAPGVVRNLGVAAVMLLSLGGLATIGTGPGWLASLARALLPAGLATGGMALWMLASSLWLKHFTLAKLLRSHRWRGDEEVLDVGCGRGLLSVTAAALVPNGHVVAIDLWQAKDLSGNGPDKLLANARAAGVAHRNTVETGDARALPFADASFDIVGSMTVVHNIPDPPGRDAAIDEMWRVLKPGGQLLVYDISHTRSYARRLRHHGAERVSLSWPILLWGMPGWRLSAIKIG